MLWSSTVFIVLTVVCGNVKSEGIFTVISSNVIQQSKKFPVLVTAQGYDKPKSLKLSILGTTDNGVSYQNSHNITLKNNRLQRVVFDLCKLELGNYYIQAESLNGDNVNYSANLQIATKKYSVFVQTDKAMYKPGDKVQFRVLVLNSETKPYKSQKVEVFITDGAQNRVKQFSRTKVTKGFFSEEFQLSDEPVLGTWTIHVKVDGGDETTKVFEVAEYILPKFEVIINTKPSIAEGEKMLVSFKAKYTYGKEIVNGTATVKVEESNFWGWIKPKQFTKTQDLKENVVEVDLVKDLNLIDIWYSQDLSVTVTVKDGTTGREQNATTTVTVYKNAYIVETFGSEDDYKPDLPFTITAFCKDLSGAPVTDLKTPVNISITYTYDKLENQIETTTYYYWRPLRFVESKQNYEKFFLNGSTSVTITIPENVTHISATIIYKGVTDYFWANSRPSESKQYISVNVLTKNLRIDRAVDVEVVGTEKLKAITYVVVASGEIILSSMLPVPNSKKFKFKFLPSFDMVPQTKLIVFYITPDGEIISDTANLEFGGDLRNFVELKVSEQAQPGENVNIEIKSQPRSFVGLLGVDQSVKLLKSGNDIEKSLVLDDLALYRSGDRYNYDYRENTYYSSYTDFWIANLLIVTNAKSEYFRPHIDYGFRPFAVIDRVVEAFSGGEPPTTTFQPPAAVKVEESLNRESSVQIRKEFPETWIFDCIDNEKGFRNISRKVPDTITSWIISGFSVSSFHGFGLSNQPAKLTVFRPFFVTLNLPYSIKRGEILNLQGMVFNYLDSSQIAEVTLYNEAKEFEFLDSSLKASTDSKRSEKISISPQSGTFVSCLIRPLKVGHITIKIVATSAVAGDGIEQKLLVEPEGVTQYINKAVFIDLRKNPEFKTNIGIEIPENAVPDSTKIEASAIGDILGPSIENLDKLIKLPYGCGEQNMLNFVPNIVVMDYLSTLNKLTPEIESKAKKYMESGYQRELTYKHDDGSYSAFGKSDKSGSTWLTAFVAKSFNQAAKYILVDQDSLKSSLEFLANVQLEDGSFPEVGHVSHKAMQGGSSNGTALTAYTLITFLECQNLSPFYQKTIDKALDFIVKQSESLIDDYSLAILSYALQLAKHEKKEVLLKKLDSRAIKGNGMIHWEIKPKSTKPTNPWDSQPETLDVEMTAYALQSYIEAGRDAEALAIMKWLISQRNSNGGFTSTQDTVVGLQALSKLAKIVVVTKNDITISLRDDTGKETKIILNEANALILQKFQLSPKIKSIEVIAKGSGFSILQVSYKFNLKNLVVSPRFNLEPKVIKSDKNSFTLSVCVNFIPDENSLKSNMAVMEVEFPSGYIFDSDSLPKLKQTEKVKRIETKNGDTVAVVYFDDLTMAAICIEFKAFRNHEVSELKPVSVVVYDYYDNSRRTTKFYSI